jgi:trigger factor
MPSCAVCVCQRAFYRRKIDMTVKSVVENKEKYEVELIVEVSAEEFEAGLNKVYMKNRGSINVPGFRKGKAPRKVIEGMYGAGVFYEEALELVYP